MPDVRLTIDLLECSLRHPLPSSTSTSTPSSLSQRPLQPQMSSQHNMGDVVVVSGTPSTSNAPPHGGVGGDSSGSRGTPSTVAGDGTIVTIEPIIPDFGRFETEEELLLFMSTYSDRYTTGATPTSNYATPTSNQAFSPTPTSIHTTPTSLWSTGGPAVVPTPTSSTHPTNQNLSTPPTPSTPPASGITKRKERKDLLMFRAQAVSVHWSIVSSGITTLDPQGREIIHSKNGIASLAGSLLQVLFIFYF